MSKTPQQPGLNAFRRNVHSQFGEDGILEECFRRLGVERGACCEFGAWDGRHLSNTWHLIERGWKAVLIEGSAKRFADLKRNVAPLGERVLPVNRYVTPEGACSLDAILREQGVSALDLLSIDIDSDDYAVFESVTTPVSVVLVEFNPSIPLDVDYVQPRGRNIGNSPSALHRLARRKGYRLFATTHVNLFFIRAERFAALGIEEPALADSLVDPIRIFYAFDGELVQINGRGNPWQGGAAVLPRPLRYLGRGGWLRDALKRVYVRLFRALLQ